MNNLINRQQDAKTKGFWGSKRHTCTTSLFDPDGPAACGWMYVVLNAVLNSIAPRRKEEKNF